MTGSDRDWRARLTFPPRRTYMATPAQINANRRNSQKSTGPQSEAGKAKSSRNNLSHGFFSSVLFMEGEDPETFYLLLTDLRAEFQPTTPYEQILVEKMAQSQWLCLRACRLQSIALGATPEI